VVTDGKLYILVLPRDIMVNSSKKRDQKAWDKWARNGSIGDINGRSYGEAYAFFDCSAPREQVAEEISYIRDLVKTPKTARLRLGERGVPCISHNSLDEELLGIALDAHKAKVKYALTVGPSPCMNNRQAADELGAILNQAYLSPLYQQDEPFRGRIVYKENGHYVDRD